MIPASQRLANTRMQIDRASQLSLLQRAAEAQNLGRPERSTRRAREEAWCSSTNPSLIKESSFATG